MNAQAVALWNVNCGPCLAETSSAAGNGERYFRLAERTGSSQPGVLLIRDRTSSSEQYVPVPGTDLSGYIVVAEMPLVITPAKVEAVGSSITTEDELEAGDRGVFSPVYERNPIFTKTVTFALSELPRHRPVVYFDERALRDDDE